ncbi:MAG: enoyl-CoA hydratase-related protein [Actinomycetota bacterium]
MSEPLVLAEAEGPVLVVTINRPEKKNASNAEVLCRLYDAWVRLDTDDSLRVAILTGKGDTFCVGMDLAEIGRLRSGVIDNEWLQRFKDQPEVILGGWLKTYRPTKPVILAAEGFARAGGTEILQGTDIRVAGESAVFGVTEVQRGLFPMAGSAVRLRRQIGYAVAAEMLLTGEDLTAQRAHQLGLVNHVVPDGQALTKAREIADRIESDDRTQGFPVAT